MFNIPQKIFDQFNSVITNQLERTVTLYYPQERQECPNCYFSSFKSSSRSVSRYKAGGPMPFDNGMPCPYCNGPGFIEQETTEEIPARIYVDAKKWEKNFPIVIPEGAIMTIFKLEYVTKVRSSSYCRISYNNLDGHFTDNFYRIGDVYSNSFNLNNVKYATTFWSKNSE